MIYAGVAGVVFSAVTRPQAVSLGHRVLLIVVSLFIGFCLGEAGLRLATQSTPYRILPPEMHAAFEPAPDVMPGIDGVSVYTTNEVGIRGDPYPSEGRYTILTIGGSSTECAYLDDTEAWPYLLQQNLNFFIVKVEVRMTKFTDLHMPDLVYLKEQELIDLGMLGKFLDLFSIDTALVEVVGRKQPVADVCSKLVIFFF